MKVLSMISDYKLKFEALLTTEIWIFPKTKRVTDA